LLTSFRAGEIRGALELARLRKACRDGHPEPDCGCCDTLRCRRGHGDAGLAGPGDCQGCLVRDGLIDPGAVAGPLC
jgi:hypothetical protein